jgi:ParB family chromosome partitioning protein
MTSKRKLILANNPLLSGPALRDRDTPASGSVNPSQSAGATPFREIRVDLIDADSNQPRVEFNQERLEELASSILKYGVLSPILVRPSKVAGRYTVVAGERRLRAARSIGLVSIPAVVDRSLETDQEKTLSIQLVENLQRADLAPLERAQAIGILRDSFSLSIREISDRLGISKSAVQRCLELLELPADLVSALQQGASESKVLLLAKIENEEIRAAYLKDLDGLSRADLEAHLKKSNLSRPSSSKAGGGSASDRDAYPMSPEDERIADEIQRALGVKVRLQRTGKGEDKGRLLLEFYSEDDLQEIFRKLIAE